MTKIKRPNLSRGTKLLVNHIHTPLSAVASDINAGTVGEENLQEKSGVFRINLHVPYLANDFAFSTYDGTVSSLDTQGEPFSIPFTIPPYQQQFSVDASNDPIININTPKIVLDEFSISFDQRAEPAAIIDFVQPSAAGADPIENTTTAYDMDFDELSAYSMQLSIWEKTPTAFNGPEDIERTIFNAPLPFGNLASTFDRSLGDIGNPCVFKDIGAAVDPYKTYGISIKMPALGVLNGSPNTRNHALVSVQFSLKFKSVLVPRDINGAPMAISNLPTKDTNGAIRTPTAVSLPVTVTAPLPGTIISSDDATGVNTSMATIDEVYRKKLSGGRDEFCEVASLQQLADDSTFEVIAVPMFNNRRYGGVYATTWQTEPYAAAGDPLWERKMVPLSYPFVVHHVVMAWNWQRFIPVGFGGAAPAPPGAIPSNAMSAHVGVAIGTGMRADAAGYQQIAELSINTPNAPGTWETHLIDKIRTSKKVAALRVAPATGVPRDWELHYVPLVPQAGVAATGSGTGYKSTSVPAFVGKSWLPTAARTVMNGGAASRAGGQEQWLEVRMKLDTVPTANNEVICGYQGHWVYIIGKKSIV